MNALSLGLQLGGGVGAVALYPQYRVIDINTTLVEGGSSAANQFTLFSNTTVSPTTNYDVDWGDGYADYGVTVSTITHTYSVPGIYRLKIRGIINQSTGGIMPNDRLKYLSIVQWGSDVRGKLESIFYGCPNLTIRATDAPNLTLATSLRQTFREVTFTLAAMESMSSWDLSTILSLENTFYNSPGFNGNISNWNVSNVTEMQFAFFGCSALNRNLNSWNISKVENFRAMFQGCTGMKNQPFNNWTISAAVPVIAANTGMNSMFAESDLLTDVTMWNMIRTNSIASMFRACTTNRDYNFGLWDIRNVSAASLFMNNATPSTISAANLGASYIAWAQQPVRALTISFGTAKYSAASASARAILTAPRAVNVASAVNPLGNGVYTFNGTRYQNANGWYFSFLTPGANQWRLFDNLDVQQAITTGSAPQQHSSNPMSGVGWTGVEAAIIITLVGAGWTITDGGVL